MVIYLFIVYLLLLPKGKGWELTPSINITTSSYRSTPYYSIRLYNNMEKKEAKTSFQCTDTIYVYITWFNMKGEHLLTTFWYNPANKEQESTRLTFHPKNQAIYNTWVWLKLKKGSKKGIFSNETGYEEFVGEWRVELFFDGKFLEKRYFSVYC